MSCQPGVSQTDWSDVPAGTSCTSGNACLVSTQCDGAGNCGSTLVPHVPALWTPRDGALTGSALTPAPFTHLRPTFTWHEATDACPTNPTFDIQIDDSCPATGFQSCTFPSPEATATGLAPASFQPSTNLPVSATAPVGRRYYWRVRACRQTTCSAWSAVGYVEVGRSRVDVDGDGYSDLIVAQLDGYNDPGEGTVYVYRGSPSGVGTTPSTTLAAPLPGQKQYFGRVMRSGDLNGDGFADLAVAAPSSYQASTAGKGVVYVYYGSASGLSTTPAATVTGTTTAASTFGHGVGAAGDVDGDGFADLVLTGPAVTAADPVVLVYGGAAAGVGVAMPKYSLTATNGTAWNAAIASDGDVTGDAISDIVVCGAATYMYAGSSSGAFGSAVSPTPFIINFDLWPQYVSTVDVDGNGYADVLIAGLLENSSTKASGIFEFMGGYGYLPTNYSLNIANPLNDQNDFQAAFTAGRFGGTVMNLAVGSVGSQYEATSVGHAYVYPPLGASTADLVSPTPATGQTFGQGLQGGSDLDGDGYDDLAVGEPWGATAYAGDVLVYYGANGGLATMPSVTLASPRAGQSNDENFGVTFAE